ncbi:MAG: hypothetical protein ABSH15_01135 [Verrucomicrobiota bacterium]|jgi:hypothetical protein
MKNKIKLTAIPILTATALSLVGCASYTIQPIASKELNKWNEGKLDTGYVFYQPELYFLVTSTPPKAAKDTAITNAPSVDEAKKSPAASPNEGPSTTFSVTPIYLPNPDKPYRVTTFNFLAKSDFTFNFKDGWQLTSIADKADNSGIATALVGQMKTILDAVTAQNLTSGSAKPLPKTFLLHPEFDDAGVITSFTPIFLPDLGK